MMSALVVGKGKTETRAGHLLAKKKVPQFVTASLTHFGIVPFVRCGSWFVSIKRGQL